VPQGNGLNNDVSKSGGFGWPGHNLHAGGIGRKLIEQGVLAATANYMELVKGST